MIGGWVKQFSWCCLLATCSVAWAQDATPQDATPQDATPQDLPEAAADPRVESIYAAVDAYVAAFNEGNVDKLAALWTSEGVYVDRSGGERVVGREALTAAMKEQFSADDRPQMAVVTESVEFISPSVALERGRATVTRTDDVVVRNYSVVYVLQNGAWLMDRVTEEDAVLESSLYDRLKPLEWMVGEWVNEGAEGTIEIKCQWTEKQNYLYCMFKVLGEEGVQTSGLQVIGWDPVKEEIRSWMFDSEGGFVAGVWKPRDDQWAVQSVATLADGGQGSFTTLIRPAEDGSFSWRKTNQVLDGQVLPNLPETVFRRK